LAHRGAALELEVKYGELGLSEAKRFQALADESRQPHGSLGSSTPGEFDAKLKSKGLCAKQPLA
jgi:hypothetical protein